MAEITTRVPGCDIDGEGERGERGERGKRGRRGHSGHDGHDGATGPTGPCCTGPTGPTSTTEQSSAVGHFVPNAAMGGSLSIASQNGLFASATYAAVGIYRVALNAIPGLSMAGQIIPLGTVDSSAGGFVINTSVAGFIGPLGQIDIIIRDLSGTPIDRPFFLDVSLIGV